MGILNFRHPEQNRLNPAFQAILEAAAPGGLNITSGYRSPAYNAKIRGAKGSQHMHGNAADIDMSGMDDAARSTLIDNLIANGARGIITYTNSPNMAHVDRGVPGLRPNVHFMHDKSSQNMGNAPAWMKALQTKHQGTSPQAAQVSGGGGQQTLAGGSRGDTVADQGLLGDDKKRGILGGLLGPKAREYMTPDRIANLQIALEGMRLNPNQGIIGAAREGIQGRRVDARDVAKEEKAGEQRNRTVEWLQSRGNSDLAAAVASGSISGQQAVGAALQPSSDGRTAQIKNYEYWKSQGIPDDEARQLARGGQTINIGGKQTAGWKKIDEKFSEVWTDWTKGGGADSAKQIAQLGSVVDTIEAGGDITGIGVGIQPDIMLAITNPEALDSREKVEEVVQRNLRLVLGAQFTEKEGERLIARAFNAKLSPEKNAVRLRALIKQMETAANGTANMVSYFNENGTLQGFVSKGVVPTVADFDAIFDSLDAQQGIGSGPIPGPFKVQGGQEITDEDLFKLYGGGN